MEVQEIKITSSIPINSPFSRERRGQKEARMPCTCGANLSEQRSVKYPLISKATLCKQHDELKSESGNESIGLGIQRQVIDNLKKYRFPS